MEVLSYILSSIIVVVTPLIFVKLLLNCEIRENKIRVVLVCLLSVIINILIYTKMFGMLRTIVSMLIYSVTIYNFYKISLKNAILTIIKYVFSLIIVELVVFVFLKQFIFSTYYLYEEFAGSVISNLVVYGSVILLTKIFSKILKIKINYSQKIIIISILTLISVLVFFFDIITSVKLGTKITLYIIAIVTFISILIFLIHEENKNIKLKIEYEKLLEFMQTYEEEIEKERILKHEHKNELITVKSKILDKDKFENIINYIDEVLGDETKFVQEDYAQFQYLPPNGIKALFYFKTSRAKNKKINISLNIEPIIKDSILKNLTTKEFKDLGVLIGVYLDNAIDASEISDKKILGVEIYQDGENVWIIISNSYIGQIEENKIGKLRFSTKGKNRGYGLLLVKEILKKSKKFICEREITPTLYIQTIRIKK